MKNLFVICLLLLLCSCGKTKNQPFLENAISVTDFRGKKVELHQPPKRVVCLLESALSGIYMLQRHDIVVGVSTNIYSSSVFNYYASLDERIRTKSIPTPGNWDFVNLESVVSLHPDLVIMWASQTEAIENLESYHIPVYAVMINGIQDVYKEIDDFGALFDNCSRADSLVSYTKNELSSLKLQATPTTKVYFMWTQVMLETSGVKSTVNEMINAAGCVNVCQAQQEHVTVNIETLLGWNPDIILMWCNEKLEPSDIINNPTFKNLHAVKTHHVYELPSAFECDLWTLKFQYVVKLLAKNAHANQYSYMNLQKEKDSMMLFLYGNKMLAKK
jgi:iron complex transport system substrate-binding protein